MGTVISGRRRPNIWHAAGLTLVVGLALAVSFPASPVGAAADPLLLEDMDGRTHDVDAMLAAGRPVVLVFWQTWCGSCKREAPELARAVREHGDALQFFGVVSGPERYVNDDKVRKVAKEWGHPQPQIRDRDLTLTERFEVSGTPVIIVLGPGAKELFRGHRLPDDWSRFVERPDAGLAPRS
jgi:thiol-disulfide isomerase/thioredoxin